MARQIKETPILKGKDADSFKERMHSKKIIPSDKKERMRKNYEKMKSLAWN